MDLVRWSERESRRSVSAGFFFCACLQGPPAKLFPKQYQKLQNCYWKNYYLSCSSVYSSEIFKNTTENRTGYQKGYRFRDIGSVKGSPKKLLLLDLCDIRQIAPDLVPVHAVACEPLVVDFEAVVFDRYGHQQTVGVEEHGAESDVLGLLHLKILDDVCGREAGADNVFHDEDMLVRDVDIDVFDDAHDTGLGGSVGNVRITDHVDLDGEVDRAGQVRQEIQCAADDADDDELLAGKILCDLRADFGNAFPDGLFVIYDTLDTE